MLHTSFHRVTVMWSIITERQGKLFLFCKNKTRFNTLLHSVRRQSVNKQYNYGLILRQTTSLCAVVCQSVCTDTTMFFINVEMREKGWKILCLIWQMTNKLHTHLIHRYTHLEESHADTHSMQTRLKSDRSLALSLHSSRLSFYCSSSVTSQRLKCVQEASKHTYTLMRCCTVASRKNYFNTNSVKTQPGRYKISCIGTKQTAF